MTDFLICDECDKGDLRVFPEETKVEEYICQLCKYGEAECLVDGLPACVGCKMNKRNQNKSPAGSIRSDNGSTNALKRRLLEPPLKTLASKNIADQLKKSLEIHVHKRGDSSVAVEFYKAHKFLQKYTAGNLQELVCLYSSKNEGFASNQFHKKCDDSKSGLIVIIKLTLGYEIAAFSWKGIRKGMTQANDPQMGGGFIRSNTFDLVPFKDNVIYSLPEGIRFSSDNDLYLNFDDKERSLCNFDPRLKGNQLWTSYIEEVSAYRLQIAE
jgi:hypothetical protein